MTEKPLIVNPRIDEFLRRGSVGEALREKLRRGGDPLRALLSPSEKRHAAQEAGAYAGLTLGDFLYDYIRIDPVVVRGIDFAQTEDLHNLLSFAHFAERQSDLVGQAFAGSVSQMQGYVAEEFVGLHLEAAGHDVVRAATANQEGWDWLVDGQPFQVKCLSSIDGVREHFERFDYPVIVNAELADQVQGIPDVYVDPELSHDAVRVATEDALHHGDELGDFEIPWISLAVSSAAGLRDFIHGSTDLAGAVTSVLTNTTGRIVCGVLGEKAAGVVGFMLFGPAGAIVGAGVGAICGGIVGREVARAGRRLLTAGEEAAVRQQAAQVAVLAVESMPRKDAMWAAKGAMVEEELGAKTGNAHGIGQYLQARIEDDRRYYHNKRQELEGLAKSRCGDLEPLEALGRVLLLTKRGGVHPHVIQPALQQLNELARELIRQRKRFAV